MFTRFKVVAVLALAAVVAALVAAIPGTPALAATTTTYYLHSGDTGVGNIDPLFGGAYFDTSPPAPDDAEGYAGDYAPPRGGTGAQTIHDPNWTGTLEQTI